MSAVGLLLLEDPKARARAEARIRNGQTRRSFFGRSGASQAKGRKPDMPPTIHDVDDEDNPVIVRPSTSLSIPSFSHSKKKSEGGSERSNSRNSVFGRKNSVGDSSIRSGNSGSSQQSGAVSMSSYATIGSDLATVKEKELVRVQPNHTASDVNGKATSFERPLSPISRSPPSLPPAARISVFDETMFKDVSRTSPDPNDDDKPTPVFQTAHNASRSSSSEASAREEEELGDLTALPGAGAAPEDQTLTASNPQRGSVRQSVNSIKPTLITKGSIDSDLKRDSLTNRSEPKRRQVSGQLPAGKSSDPSLRSDSTGSLPGTANPEIRIDYKLHPHDMRQARHSSSTGKSTSLSFASGTGEPTVFTETNWEDHIDYIYEQGAEAACDFDWEFDAVGRAPSMYSNGAGRLSDGSGNFHAHASPALSDNSRRDSRTISGATPTIAERRQGQKGADGARVFVGHRGFAAARNSGEESRSKRSNPTTPTFLNIGLPTKDGVPSPADSGTPLTPYTPNMTQFPVPPTTAGRLSDNLSDQEPWRNGTKHRKSSSYGSIESSVRPSAAMTAAKDTNRWSSASQSSVPSQIASRPKRNSSVNKGMISAPVRLLPQHPEDDDRAFEVEVRPEDTNKNAPPSPEFLLRRPQTSGERLLLQAAGRQRYRPATMNGGPASSRVPQHQHTASTGGRAQPASTEWL